MASLIRDNAFSWILDGWLDGATCSTRNRWLVTQSSRPPESSLNALSLMASRSVMRWRWRPLQRCGTHIFGVRRDFDGVGLAVARGSNIDVRIPLLSGKGRRHALKYKMPRRLCPSWRRARVPRRATAPSDPSSRRRAPHGACS